MPELPEVETIVRGLSGRLTGKSIAEVRVPGPAMLRSDPAAFRDGLVGRRIQSVQRHGKGIYISLDASGNFPSSLLRIHLGMTGRLVFAPAATPMAKHTHVIFRMEGLSEELRHNDPRRFGRVQLLSNQAAPSAPDAWLANDATIFAALRKRKGMLKHTLLNQNVIAGLGNIYVDESLYKVKLHPKQRLEKISDERLRALCAAIHTILKKSIGVGGTSFRDYVDTEGTRGGFKNWLHVYGKQGTQCRTCGTMIRRIVVVGRGTHLCPGCQRKPRG